MTRREILLLLLLSAIWGGSFLFIKVGVDELEPSVVALSRVAIGALVLRPLPLSRGGLGSRRSYIVPLVVLALFNNALPFWLF
ncbi:EamA family transporter, partial [Gaiella sp.]|uniref:EamA family transporter n=1 Tax=Gaiella sp. TaxID=2663207 RepID=UPI003982F415